MWCVFSSKCFLVALILFPILLAGLEGITDGTWLYKKIIIIGLFFWFRMEQYFPSGGGGNNHEALTNNPLSFKRQGVDY